MVCRITTASEANTPLSDDCDGVVNENFNNDDSAQKSASKLTQHVRFKQHVHFNGMTSSSVIGKGVISRLYTVCLTAVCKKCVIIITWIIAFDSSLLGAQGLASCSTLKM